MRRGIRRRVAVGLIVSLVGLAGLWGTALAGPAGRALAALDGPDPPELDAEILSDSLASETVFAAGACPTGKGVGHYVDEGFRLASSGPCQPNGEFAEVAVRGRGITVADGEVSVAFKVAEDGDRAAPHLFTRLTDRSYVATFVHPRTGAAALYQRAEGVTTTVAMSEDIRPVLAEDGDWNRMSLRVSGSDAWLILNDTPVLFASGVPDSAGGVAVRLVRVGPPRRADDDELAVVVFSDLLVWSLADASPDRAPTFQRP
jgi:hypothetical protein